MIENKPAKADGKMTQEAIANAIQQGNSQPLKGQEFRFGIIYPNGQIKTADPIFEKIAKYLLKKMPTGIIPPEGLALVIRERGTETFEEVETFLKERLIPYFKVSKTIPTKVAKTFQDRVDEKIATDQFSGPVNRFFLKKFLPFVKPKGFKRSQPKDVHVLQTVSWPFFKEVISGDPLSSDFKSISSDLGKLSLFDLRAPGKQELEAALKQQYQPLKERLSALEAATMQYSDRANLLEGVISMSLGAMIGGGGEYWIHHNMTGGGMEAAAARTLTLVAVDMVDGVLGEMQVLESDLTNSGMDLNYQSLYGSGGMFGPNTDGSRKNLLQLLSAPFRPQGKAALFVKRAIQSAVKGAGLGAVLSAPAGIVLTDPTASVPLRSLSGATGTLGTATSIPFNIRATLPQVYLATLDLIREGKIHVPPEAKKDEKTLQRYALQIAEQDLLSRLGFAASMKAYSMTPLSGAVLFSEMFGIPREVAQTVYMSIAPAMENLLRLALTVNRLKITNPRNMAKAENMILDAEGRPFNDSEEKRLERLFVDRWGRSVAWALTHIPWPVHLPQIADSKTLIPPPPVTATAAKPAS